MIPKHISRNRLSDLMEIEMYSSGGPRFINSGVHDNFSMSLESTILNLIIKKSPSRGTAYKTLSTEQIRVGLGEVS